jgi:DNA-directed RNA polymerase subunit RPC12/RpoP
MSNPYPEINTHEVACQYFEHCGNVVERVKIKDKAICPDCKALRWKKKYEERKVKCPHCGGKMYHQSTTCVKCKAFTHKYR